MGRLLAAQPDVTVIEADAVVRALQRKGEPVLEAMVERFGESILQDDGELDREAMAQVVFADGEARRDLEAIVHPAVGIEMVRLRSLAESKGEVIFLDIPLLAEAGPDAKQRWGLDAVVVVYCPLDVALSRLVEQRGMDEDDARARMAAQLPPEDRRTAADFIVDNSGGEADLAVEVAQLWHLLQILGERRERPPQDGS